MMEAKSFMMIDAVLVDYCSTCVEALCPEARMSVDDDDYFVETRSMRIIGVEVVSFAEGEEGGGSTGAFFCTFRAALC